MDLGFVGKAVLVTGGSKGIGRACAELFSEEGASVGIIARGAPDLEAAAREIAASTGRAPFAVTADCCDPAQVGLAVDQVVRRLGRIDVLVNSAGAARPGTFASLSDDDWVSSMEAKFFATIRALRAVVPVMRRAGGGRIVNIVGYGGQQPAAWGLAPSAANAALMNVTRSLAAELAGDGILVNAINPGLIETPRFVNALVAIAAREGTTAELVRRRLCEEIPLGRIGGPREIAGLVAFLASQHASYITGATFLVDGGATRGV